MFDVSASELLVIGAVALIVIGPKELPGVLRMVGQTVGKLKRMAGEFRTQFDDAMREADLHEIQKTVQDTTSSVSNFNPINTIRNEITSTVADMKGAKPAAAAAGAAGATATEAAEQGPPVMKLDPVPDPAPVRLAPAVEPQPTPDVVRTASAPAETAKKPKRATKKKPAGDEA